MRMARLLLNARPTGWIIGILIECELVHEMAYMIPGGKSEKPISINFIMKFFPYRYNCPLNPLLIYITL
jgi:hypothetical protein